MVLEQAAGEVAGGRCHLDQVAAAPRPAQRHRRLPEQAVDVDRDVGVARPARLWLVDQPHHRREARRQLVLRARSMPPPERAPPRSPGRRRSGRGQRQGRELVAPAIWRVATASLTTCSTQSTTRAAACAAPFSAITSPAPCATCSSATAPSAPAPRAAPPPPALHPRRPRAGPSRGLTGASTDGARPHVLLRVRRAAVLVARRPPDGVDPPADRAGQRACAPRHHIYVENQATGRITHRYNAGAAMTTTKPRSNRRRRRAHHDRRRGWDAWRLAFDELYGIPADIGQLTDAGMSDPDVRATKNVEAVECAGLRSVQAGAAAGAATALREPGGEEEAGPAARVLQGVRDLLPRLIEDGGLLSPGW